MAGPIWTAPLYDADFVQHLLADLKSDENTLTTRKRLIGILAMISEELSDVPLFHDLSNMMRILKAPMLKHSMMLSALLHAGYRCSISHTEAKAVKTDAPVDFVWQVLQYWVSDCIALG